MKIISVVGARPNFMKVAPFIRAIQKKNVGKQVVQHLLLHTGQHYDDRMSQQFFEDLKIPEADINLGIGSGSHAEQVGYSMIALQQVFEKEKPDAEFCIQFHRVRHRVSRSILFSFLCLTFIFHRVSLSYLFFRTT